MADITKHRKFPTVKPRLFVLTLAAAVLFSGCSAMLERSYVSSAAHVDYDSVTEDPSILRAETYRGLVDAVLYFINEHADQGVIRLYNYTTDVEADLEQACLEVTHEDPLSAFVVADISYDFSRIVSYYEVTVDFTYSHTAEEVEAMSTVTSSTGIQRELQQAMADFSSSLVLWVSYFTEDEDLVRAMAVKAYYDTPQAAFGIPNISVSLYPGAGTRYIIEITLDWPGDSDQLAQRSMELLSAASQLLEEHPPEGEQYTPAELTALLNQTVSDVDPSGSDAPDSALHGENASQLAHTLALELLFQLAGFDATLVSGTAEGNAACWLIVGTDDGYRHLVLTEEEPRLLTDPEMTDLGYLWNADLYPDCVDYGADLTGGSPAES